MSITLTYFDNDQFYEKLDKEVKAGNKVNIQFTEQKLSKDSKLWDRLKKTQNYDVIQNELKKLEETKEATMFSSAFLDNTTVGVANGIVMTGSLVVFLSTLVFLLLAYAIYTKRKIRIKLDPPTIEIE
jgi:positive regulator of sigma E activity